MRDLAVEYNPHALQHAIAQVFDSYEREGRKPGSEWWVQYQAGREEMAADVITAWQKLLTKVPVGQVWHMDAIVSSWTHYRKTAPEQRVEWALQELADQAQQLNLGY